MTKVRAAFLLPLLLAAGLLSSGLSATGASLPSITRLWNTTRPICTVFAISEHQWLTAAHCVLDGSSLSSSSSTVLGFRTIRSASGEPLKADVVKWDERLDLALLQVNAEAVNSPLHFALDSPAVGDTVSLVGFPKVWLGDRGGPITFINRIAALHVQTDCYGPVGASTPSQTIMQGSGASGNSGSPVLNGGRVIGVLQCGFPQGIEAFSPWDTTLRWFRAAAK